MRYIKRYDNYKKIDRRFEYAISVVDINDDDLFEGVFYRILEASKVDIKIKQEIIYFIDDYKSLNEGFMDVLKNKFQDAAKMSNLLSDKAESVLGNLLQRAKDVTSFVSKIIEGIKELFRLTIEKSKIFFEEQIKNGGLKNKIEELTKTKKDGLVSDIKTIRLVTKFYRTDFLSKIINVSKDNLTNFLSSDQSTNEQLINEGGNVIATLVHGLEKLPPFSWLSEVQKAGEAGANKVVEMVSNLTVKLGGNAFSLPVIALLIGVTFEQAVKNQVGGWLLNLVGTTNPLGMAISGMKMVAVFIALIVSVDAIMGERILGHGH
jgi:hypothetical protein